MVNDPIIAILSRGGRRSIRNRARPIFDIEVIVFESNSLFYNCRSFFIERLHILPDSLSLLIYFKHSSLHRLGNQKVIILQILMIAHDS
jgi:hypothetical protein